MGGEKEKIQKIETSTDIIMGENFLGIGIKEDAINKSKCKY